MTIRTTHSYYITVRNGHTM